jgi:hypothetical protein
VQVRGRDVLIAIELGAAIVIIQLVFFHTLYWSCWLYG